ncbi:hypothetical protein GGF46_001230 [Coemansia sp. RSA 552]|nr:hypothetical protein GGF46_001230 [Coemansia sp. RSA 552]
MLNDHQGMPATTETPQSRRQSTAPSSAAGSRASSPSQRPMRPSPPKAQLLKKIHVAGVTIEVVRQNSTIIYRLPGNMPVSSLTEDQRKRVMAEIQRQRDSPASMVPGPRTPGRPPAAPRPVTPGQRTPTRNGALQHSRPRLPSIAPRPQMRAGPQSAPIGGTVSPRTPVRDRLPLPSSGGVLRRTPLPGKSALEVMYESAYFKLLSGPAEALRRLNPPVDLSSIVDSAVARDAVSPASLLKILKALTKAQASQLAQMHDNEARGMYSPAGSQPPSGSVSPASYLSDADGAATPTRKRKYNKTGKYSVKKRMAAAAAAAAAGSNGGEALAGRFAMGEVRKPQSAHEREVCRRFREALVEDHRLVTEADCSAPFRDTRDMVQRLLPFHVFQVPDALLETEAERMGTRAQRATVGLGRRVDALSRRYRDLLVREGASDAGDLQLDILRVQAATEEMESLRDAQLQRDISALGAAHFGPF